MHIDEVRDYCLTLPEVEETLPFGPGVLVFKTGGKMFVLLSLDEEQGRMTLKCDPVRAEELREKYPALVVPGYHTNKKHWNTVYYERLPGDLVCGWIDHAHQLVAPKPKKRP
jgi:predicted DNA-binding protein (MmcQ/YjbR family)